MKKILLTSAGVSENIKNSTIPHYETDFFCGDTPDNIETDVFKKWQYKATAM